jgi:GntR family transcriptional repressor for pyruvate dehydrogenase complex
MRDDISAPDTVDLFTALARERSLVTRVAEQIESLILSGRLRIGDPLPPEHKLAESCGVSRTVIREAVARLQAQHLVEAQPNGGGLLICAPSPESVGRSMSLMLRVGREEIAEKALEVRRLIEVEVAKLAAERRTEVDLQRMAAILAEAEKHRDDPIRFPQLDVEFHRALALATQNEYYVILLDAIADTLLSFRLMALRVPGMPGRSLHYHQAIFEQVQAGSAAGARAAMRDHMDEAQQTIREAQTLDTTKGQPL